MFDPDLGRRQAVNPAAPGNSLHFRGVRVALAETYQSTGKNGGRSLGIDVTPAVSSDFPVAADAGPTRSGAGGAPGQPVAGTTGGGTASARSKSREPIVPSPAAGPTPEQPGGNSGFTREEELFRMKWGWAAFDAARREADRTANP